MTKRREAWLKSTSRGDDPLPDKWLEERPDLLRQVAFARTPQGVRHGDHLVYYAPGKNKKKLFAVVRAQAHGESCKDLVMPVRPLLVIPDLRLAPDLAVLEKSSDALKKADALTLTDAEYSRFVNALSDVLSLIESSSEAG